MAVPIKQWDIGVVLQCHVTLTQQGIIGDSLYEINFIVVYNEDEIAQGWCYVPISTKLGTHVLDVRIVSSQTNWGETIICASDIKLGERWLSDISGVSDPLHPHSKPRSVRSN